MTYIIYRDQKFGPSTSQRIEQALDIIGEYEAEGMSLTLRQIYYQFVSRDLIPNNLKTYKALGDVLDNARMAGLISWDSIVDRTRSLTEWQHQESAVQSMRDLRRGYFHDRWANQPRRFILMIEKEALVGVVERVCMKWDVPFIACRGYMSSSAAWKLGQKIQEWREDGQEPAFGHIGDHDPSGKDMTRDNFERLSMFANPNPEENPDWLDAGADVSLERLALNIDQIHRYRPPPNPAKLTDSRAEAYISEFGYSSWEADALEPRVIVKLIEDAILAVLDMDLWEESGRKQDEERAKLDGFIATLEG